MSLGCPGCGSVQTNLHYPGCTWKARHVETKDIGQPSKWLPINNRSDLAALGKLLEEVNELGAIIARTIIQGLDGVDPETGKPNLVALAEEIADVRGLSKLNIDRFGLDDLAISTRAERKRWMKLAWIRLLDDELALRK